MKPDGARASARFNDRLSGALNYFAKFLETES